MLINSNVRKFKYCLVWKKNLGSGVGSAKYKPMRYHEDIVVFGNPKSHYFPQPTKRFSKTSEKACKKPIRSGSNKSNHQKGMQSKSVQYNYRFKGPESVIEVKAVPNAGGYRLHPTQKPVELMEYLVKTYSQNSHTVLDFAMGSGTTGVACINLGRKFIGIELDPHFFSVAKERLVKTTLERSS